LPEGKIPISLNDGTHQRLPAPREKRNARLAYSFPSVKELIKVCKILRTAQLTPESRAFYDENGIFYLLLTDAGVSAFSRLDALTFIVEFGRRENPDCITSYINEHGRIICDSNAIETLSAL
jgi:negative regulator of genetic competence, sporulation and motility